MDTRHALAYALIGALFVAAGIVVWVIKKRARSDRREARRPIRLMDDQSDD
jgi:cbb3-type cytochrome oxidase subunit 3